MTYDALRHPQGTRGISSAVSSPVRESILYDRDSDDDLDLDVAAEDGPDQTFQLRNILKFSDRFEESKPRRPKSRENDEFEDDREHRRPSNATSQSFTPDEERRVIRLLDRKLVLSVAGLYMLSFLDRSSNAKIAGMSRDLKLSSNQYEWLLRSFYLTYITFEWMALLYKIIPPHIYIASAVALWGLVASLQSLANSFGFLLFLRAILGIAEAAYGPGVPFYLSFFYKRDELAFRTGLFISAAPLATSFASSLAWVITKAGHHIPVAPWRLLFLIEGFPSVIAAVFAWYYIPDGPESAVYLNEREKIVAKSRLRKEKGLNKASQKRRLRWEDIFKTLREVRGWLTALMFFCCNVAFSSLPVFLPTIIEEMGHSALTSQALSAPPFLLAFVVVLATAYFSDKYQSRSTFVFFHAILAATGYAIMALTGGLKAGPGWRYAGVFPATMGFFSAITVIITWTINNQVSDEKKGTSVAMLNYVGQLGPLVGTHLYPESDAPYFVKGSAICAVFMGAAAVLALALRMLLAAENQRAASEIQDHSEAEGLVTEEQKKDPVKSFRFML